MGPSTLRQSLHARVLALLAALVLVPMAHPLSVAAAGQILASDSFTRTVNGGWGNADTGGAYTLDGGNAVFSVDGAAGSINLPKAGANRGAILGATSAHDVDLRLRVRATQPTGGPLFIYGVARRNGNNEYRPKLVLNANGTVSAHAGVVVGGVESSAGAAVVVTGLTQVPGTFIWLRALITGASPTTINVKAWADGLPEPATWNFTATNSAAALQGSGAVGLRTYLQTTVTNAPSTVSFDDLYVESQDPPPPPVANFAYAQTPDTLNVAFTDTSTGSPTQWSWDFGDGGTATDQNPTHVYAAAGTFDVSLTVTSSGGPNTVIKPVTVAQPPPVVAADSFARTNTGSWWVADTGGLYSYSGRLSDFNLDGAVATFTLPSANQSRSAFLYDVQAHDTEISFSFSTDKQPTGASVYVYGTLRRTTDGLAYRPKLRIAPDGSVYAHAGRLLSSGESSLGPEVKIAGLTHAADAVIRFRARAIGTSPTTVQVRAWAAGQPEPTTWNYTATDSSAALQVPGAVGVIAYVGAGATNTPLLVRVDDLLVTTTDPIARVDGQVLVAAGDIASCTGTADEATATLLKQIGGTVATLGDNAYPSGAAQDFTNCYDPSWGQEKSRTYPALGNHEYDAAVDAGPYYDYFGAAAATRAKGWYAFDLGTWRVYVLNSNCGIVSCVAGSEQEQWLRADMAANPRTCSMAIWHHPRFSSGAEHGSSPSVQPFWQALYDAGAEIVLSGHDHDYERFAPQDAAAVRNDATGIREFVTGTGGAALRPGFAAIVANSEVRQATNNGVLKLVLGAGTYEWEFIPIAGQTYTDRGSGTCH